MELAKMNFQMGKILSVTTGELLSENHISGIYEILGFMTGENLYTHQLGRAMEMCASAIIEAYPDLSPDNPQLSSLVANLLSCLEEQSTNDKGKILLGWLRNKIYPIYGEYRTIEIFPEWRRNPKDPIDELEEMVPQEKIVMIEMESKPIINSN